MLDEYCLLSHAMPHLVWSCLVTILSHRERRQRNCDLLARYTRMPVVDRILFQRAAPFSPTHLCPARQFVCQAQVVYKRGS